MVEKPAFFNLVTSYDRWAEVELGYMEEAPHIYQSQNLVKSIPLESSFKEQSFETSTKSVGYASKELWPGNQNRFLWLDPPLTVSLHFVRCPVS